LNVVEGTQEARLVAQGANGARFDLVDTGGGSDDKWLTFIVDTGIGRFVSISDNGLSVISDDILVMDLGTGNVGIGTSSPLANADLTLEGGAMAFKEMTTPTADTNYGKIYTKTDNKLYFQDGAVAEHEVAVVTQ